MDKDIIKSAVKKGLVQIFSASFINNVVQFGTVAILGRLITKQDYGNFTYAQNIMNMALLIEGLGVTSGILQYSSISENPEEKYSYYRYGTKIGIVVNFLITVFLFLYASFGRLPIKGSRIYVYLLSCIPLLRIVFSTTQSYLRATLRNREYSRLTVCQTIIYFASTTSLSYFFGAKGLVMGMYISYAVTSIIGIVGIRQDIQAYRGRRIKSREVKKQFLKFSIITIMSSVMSQMLYLLDSQLIGIITKDAEVLANYNMATKLPYNLTFISMSVMTFAYPYFAQNRNDNEWVRSKLNIILKYLGILNIVISLGGVIFAELIMKILFGAKYISAAPAFRVLMVGYFICGTFRIPYGNILASLGEVKANLINAIFSGIANIILDVVLIIKFGSIGAAYATTGVYIISSIIHAFFIRRHFKKVENAAE